MPQKENTRKREWERPKIKPAGTVDALGGMAGKGKVSSATQDMGEIPRKAKGGEH